jgi:hypothetical protein
MIIAPATQVHPMPSPPSRPGVSSLHEGFLQTALRRFFERAEFSVEPVIVEAGDTGIAVAVGEDGRLLTVRWLGTLCVLRVSERRPFSAHEVRMARAIATVLETRYRAIFNPHMMAEERELFRGVLEDRYIGAFLEGGHHRSEGDGLADSVAAAIEVLRVAALSTYENRSISTGVLMLGRPYTPRLPPLPDLPSSPYAPPPFASALTATRSFYRLADGEQTLFLVDRDNMLIDIIDARRWARDSGAPPAPHAPVPQTYHAHALATANGTDVCVVLGPTQEMKIFAEGTQLFSFHNASWHLLDVQAKYDQWAAAVDAAPLAECLFQAALDLADRREGALFVVLPESGAGADRLIAPADRLDLASGRPALVHSSRRDLLYLLTGRSVTDLDPSVLGALASLDGAIVVDRTGRLLAAGAILRHPPVEEMTWVPEGARTTAALAASRYGPVLKVSEDGIITFFDGERIWDI